MKQKAFLIAVLFMALAIPHNVKAHDFSAVTPSGQTLYYNIVNGTAVIVYPGTYYAGYTKPSGNLIIPDSVSNNGIVYPVTAIDYAAFAGCEGLVSVSIGGSILNIGNWAFDGCSGLSSIIWNEGVFTIGQGSFHSCSSLLSIAIPNSVTNIGENAFSFCSGMTTVEIGDGVTCIGQESFKNCGNLTSITIGCSVTNIYGNAFNNCSNLTEIISRAIVAPLVENTTFSGVPINIDVHIPCGCQMSYYSRWTYFAGFTESPSFSFNAISENLSMGNVNILTQPTCQNPTAVFNAIANDGYSFSYWSDGNSDNPRSLIVTQDTSITAYFEIATNDTIHDTIYINVHDTTILHDTIYLPYYVHDTTIMYDTLYTTVHDTVIAYVNIPVHDTVFAYIEVPVHDTVYLPQYIYDTIWLHDTITIHDTIYITSEGIDGVDALNAKVYSCNGQIVVDGASGNTVTLYDASGRVLAIKQDNYSSLRFDAPVSGTYMIKIGAYPARKVVVIR